MKETFAGAVLLTLIILACLWIGGRTTSNTGFPDDVGYCDARTGCW